MAIQIRRREFIFTLGGAAAAWPLAARAQQQAMPVVGFLSGASPGAFTSLVAAFRRSLTEAGFIEGQNVAIEYRWAEGQYDRLPALAANLVAQQATVIVATGGPASGLAAKAATSSIPIVFISGSDPVDVGLVTGLGRPEGNATGITFFGDTLMAKRLELLRELVPNATTIAVLVNPTNADTPGQLREVQAAAQAVGQQLIVLNASTPREIEAVFAVLVQRTAGALMIAGDPFFLTQRELLVSLAERHAMPTIYASRELAARGGLMTYGVHLADVYRQVGVYTARILKGAKPADLPVLRPTRFELIIDLKTAKSLGLTVPPSIMLRADEVIE
jgi:putative tryptophan/tyrosine transport system substrate-binding protein